MSKNVILVTADVAGLYLSTRMSTLTKILGEGKIEFSLQQTW